MLSSCVRNPLAGIESRLKRLGDIFCDKYSGKSDNQPGLHAELSKFRSQLGQTLYYRLLESILTLENKRGDKGDLSVSFVTLK